MRIFALETDIEKLKKRYLAPGEEELLTVHLHFLAFLIPFFRWLLVVIPLGAVGIFLLFQLGTTWSLIGLGILIIDALILLVAIANGLARWLFTVVFVTTEKVVFIRHKSIFYQDIDPNHLENISSTEVKSQLLGIFNCGKLYLFLRERIEATTKKVRIPYVPRVNDVAAVVENAIVLAKQRLAGEETEETEEELQSNIHHRQRNPWD